MRFIGVYYNKTELVIKQQVFNPGGQVFKLTLSIHFFFNISHYQKLCCQKYFALKHGLWVFTILHIANCISNRFGAAGAVLQTPSSSFNQVPQ